jgi:hypothetical protein
MGRVINATPQPLYLRERDQYPLYRRLGGLQAQSGRVRNILPPTGIRSSDHPGGSESLYRRSYPNPVIIEVTGENSVSLPHCPSQIGLNCDRIRVSAVGEQRLTARAMARTLKEEN